MPKFDERYVMKPPSRRDRIVAYNAGDADAARVRIEPIRLSDGEALVTDGHEALIPKGQEHAFDFGTGHQEPSTLSTLRTPVDIPDKVFHEALYAAAKSGGVEKVREFPIFVDFEDLQGRRYRAVWSLQFSPADHRVRAFHRSTFRTYRGPESVGSQ